MRKKLYHMGTGHNTLEKVDVFHSFKEGSSRNNNTGHTIGWKRLNFFYSSKEGSSRNNLNSNLFFSFSYNECGSVVLHEFSLYNAPRCPFN